MTATVTGPDHRLAAHHRQQRLRGLRRARRRHLHRVLLATRAMSTSTATRRRAGPARDLDPDDRGHAARSSAQDGAISATFTTSSTDPRTPATSDTFVASNSVGGDRATASSAPTARRPTTPTPRRSSRRPRCSRSPARTRPTPEAAMPIRGRPRRRPPTVTVNPTATSSVVIPEPAMIVRVWGDTYDDTERRARRSRAPGRA